jgi:hypothetical protein
MRVVPGSLLILDNNIAEPDLKKHDASTSDSERARSSLEDRSTGSYLLLLLTNKGHLVKASRHVDNQNSRRSMSHAISHARVLGLSMFKHAF